MPRGPTGAGLLAGEWAPSWRTTDHATAVLYCGGAVEVLRTLRPASVHQVVTSPPYWALRDYGGAGQLGVEESPDCGTLGRAQCGACFVCAMVGVFRQVARVLRRDGTVWLNLGDSYTGGGGYYPNAPSKLDGASLSARQDDGSGAKPKGPAWRGLPAGNLVGVPWRVALALQADGWTLRNDIIWHKPAPMPEPVKTRCTRSHEYVFVLTRGRDGYYYDRVPTLNHDPDMGTDSNKRTVWTVNVKGYEGAHYAAFPPELIIPMIETGTSEAGACGGCGAPWDRLVAEETVWRERPNAHVKYAATSAAEHGAGGPNGQPDQRKAGVRVRTLGWAPGCECAGPDGEPLPVVPCTVLDPFVGSGTTVAEAARLGRRGWGIDLNPDYLVEHAVPRVSGALLSRPDLAHLVPR